MKRWFWNLSLKRKFYLLILMAVSIMMLLETWNRQAAYNQYNRLLYEKNSQIVMLYMDYIENVFERMENITYLMIADPDLQENMVYLRDHFGDGDWSRAKAAVQKSVNSYAYREEYFSSFLVSMDQFVFGFGDKDLGLYSDLTPYTKEVQDANGQMRLISEDQRLILVREIRKMSGLELSNLGYIVAQADFSAIISDIKKSLRHADLPIDVSVYDEDICLYQGSSPISLEKRSENGWYIDGEEFVTVYTSKKLGYTIVICTPYGELRDTIEHVSRRSFLLSFLVLLAALILSSLLVKMVIQDFNGLIRKMDELGAGRLPDRENGKQYQKRTDEIGRMYRHFYQMALDYHKLTEEYYNNRLLLKEAEMAQMQKQIQPHFLFNTLTAIGWMAYAHKDEETAAMIETLGRMMRVVTENKETLISVENDLQMVEDYLKIQKFRFRNRLNVEIQISPETRKSMIPRISLQPLVENSVTYALEEQVSGCQIRIFDRITPDAVEIVVEDNGPGFDEDLTERLERGSGEAKGTGTALLNIQKRLQYTFSEEYGLSFHRLKDGMQVIIRIPNQKTETVIEENGRGDVT